MNNRTEKRYKDVLNENKMEIIDMMPIFYFMNTPIDTARIENKLIRYVLPYVFKIIYLANYIFLRLGFFGRYMSFLLGAICYFIDGIILKYVRDGPSTKLALIIKKN